MPLTASEALALLTERYREDRLGHAYLITGCEGSGKRNLVRELCSLILGARVNPLDHPDAHVLEPESKSRRIRIEAVRSLERELQMRSLRGGRKIAVIFDADRLVEQAANAFLKTLEEPPAESHLFLVSSLPDQLPETIISRCLELRLDAKCRPVVYPAERKLLETLQAFTHHHSPDLPRVFALIRQFQDLLAEVKLVAQEENERAFKRDESLYKQVSNRDGLEEREEYYKALTESRYIAERSRLLGAIEQWWADVLRQQYRSSELYYAEFAAATADLATRFTTVELLRKNAALGTLRDQLGRNVQEQLAIEVAFIKAFESGAQKRSQHTGT